MKLFPYLFQFISGRNSKLDAEVAPGREVSKNQRRSVRLYLVAVRAPNDQLHVVAIPRCEYDERTEPDFPNSTLQ